MSPVRTSMMTRFVVLLSVIKVTAAALDTIQTTPLKCQNGGASNGVQCDCPSFAEGTRCQTIKDRIELGTNYEVSMRMMLTVDYPYTENLNNVSSPERQDFQSNYTEIINPIFQGLIGSNVINKLSNTNGWVTADSTIFMTFRYNQTRTVLEQYEEKLQEVRAELQKKTCKSRAMCIKSYSVDAIRPMSKNERCAQNISLPFLTFFDPAVSTLGLACVSNCEPSSPNYLNCNSGSCQIKGEDGPHCFCPRTDLYLYTYSNCQGSISLVAMYGGVGATIGLLAIIGIVLGVFLYRKKYYY